MNMLRLPDEQNISILQDADKNTPAPGILSLE